MKKRSDGYELYRFDSPGLGGYITLSVNPDALLLEDYTFGSDVAAHYSRGEREYNVSLNEDDAIKILEANDLALGEYPIYTLGLWFAERYKGKSDATGSLLKIAEKAGVKALVSAW
jgi:hypothetical protein